MPDQPDLPDLPEDKRINMGGDLTEALWDGDYQPLWLEDLPISAELRMRLEEWIRLTNDFEYYLPKKDRAPFDLKGFTIAGLDIARCLKAELPDWTITYHDEYLWQNMDELFLTNEQCQYDVTADCPLFPPWHDLAKPAGKSHTILGTEAEKYPSRQLRNAYAQIQAQCPEMLRLRIHRALSWMSRAERLKDEDGSLLSLWIALDALHADNQSIRGDVTGKDTTLECYLQKLLHHDHNDTIRETIEPDLIGCMTALLEDPYLFMPFWQHKQSLPGYENWAEQLHTLLAQYRDALQEQDISSILHCAFIPLAVLRSQIMNGGATWQSMANRQAVKHGLTLLSTLLPAFVRVMLSHTHAGWDKPLYLVSTEDISPHRAGHMTGTDLTSP